MTLPSWVGPVIGILGLAFAVYQYRQRARVESVVKDTLRRLAGVMRVVHPNANWVDSHLRIVGHLFAEASPDLTRIRRETFDAARDATACSRQLVLAHSQIRGIQQSLFKDIAETLPEIQSDDVRAAGTTMEASPRADEKRLNPPQ
jgi:hypothetical protein